jgi:hypothetical protein
MAANTYKFVDHWHISYPIEMVWDVLSLPQDYPTWWRGVYLFVTNASRWLLKSETNGTNVTLEWNPRVEKPIVKFLSPVLKPIFHWNHHWTMRRGEVQLAAYLSERTVRP